MVDARPTVRDEAAYDAVVAAARDAVAERMSPAVHDVMRVLESWRATDRAISGRADLMTLPAMTDMRAQVARLMEPGFVGEAGVTRLRDYPRYLAAVTHRRERLDGQVPRDRQLQDQLSGLQDAWLHAVAALPEGSRSRSTSATRAGCWRSTASRSSPSSSAPATRSATSGSAR